ncbi:MAG: hypothetical protein E6J87_13445 [Deltaproteobacteria bacterium]|nr:MAG: hypothetical protein E6J87_13445 [Deltaproteobacteria bacterium]
MDRPLWQMLLPLFLIGLTIHRATIGFVLYETEMSPALVAAYVLQTASALAAAVAIWLGRPWTVGILLALGALLAAASLLEGFWLGLRPPVVSVSEVLVIALSTGALALVMRREFGGEGGGTL